MFQHTLDRMMWVTSPARTVVVVGRGHQEAWGQIGERHPGMVDVVLARDEEDEAQVV